jgi:MATE family multidrug resistance protein
MLIVGLALALLREPLMLVFNQDASVVALGATLALIAALYQPFDGFGIIAQGVLRGAKQTAIPTFIMLGSGLFVFIPLVWLLGSHQGMGIRGAWIAAVVHVIVVAVLVGIAVLRSKICSETTPVPSTA